MCYLRKHSFLCVTLLPVRHESFLYGTWLIHACDTNHSHVGHDWFIYTTWLMHICNMTHSYVRHDSFICATWLIHMSDLTHSYARHDSFSWAKFSCATWLMHMCDMTHSYEWLDTLHMHEMTHSHMRHDSFKYPGVSWGNRTRINLCGAESKVKRIGIHSLYSSTPDVWVCEYVCVRVRERVWHTNKSVRRWILVEKDWYSFTVLLHCWYVGLWVCENHVCVNLCGVGS